MNIAALSRRAGCPAGERAQKVSKAKSMLNKQIKEGAAGGDNLLEVRHLRTYFYTSEKKEIPAVDDVSFSVRRGETLCIVGESGCGKSVTSLSVMKLVSTPPGKYVSGEILFDGENLLAMNQKEIRALRCKEISMIFQEPMTALNPVHKIGDQIAEALIINERMDKKEARQRAVELLRMVGVPDPKRCADSYPHQLSGGMRQRAMIAMAFSCGPKLLLADEPTTALDVTVQAQILDLIQQLKEQRGMTVVFVTHDLGIVADIADRVIVMYAGRVVEEAECAQLFARPLHPYTQGLLRCIPRIDDTRELLDSIEGQVPTPADFPKGCRFHPRCPHAADVCRTVMPEPVDTGDHIVACHLYEENGAGKERVAEV